jgi:hypothetical protein
VFSGLDGSTLYTWNGDSSGDDFGASVSGAGDVNGDNFDDLIVGARKADTNGSDSGSARVFSGVDGSILYTWNGDSATDGFGRSVSGAGDVNGDGFADLIVSGIEVDPSPSNSGSARVFAGNEMPLTLSGPLPGTTGVLNTLTATRAEPNGKILFTGRGRHGITKIACASGHAIVNIDAAKVLASVSADHSGTASISGAVPPRLGGHTIRFQAVEFETCRFTNLAVHTFP